MAAPTILVRYVSAYFELWAATASILPTTDQRCLAQLAETRLQQLANPSVSVVADLLFRQSKEHVLTTAARLHLQKLAWGLSIVAELGPNQRREVSQSASIFLNGAF
ncbi:hypothetical protein C6P88_19595 [Burkholderia contaminans]|nr:hypothetical protein C6P88_19595 [Burkholderia contaminans]